MTRALAELKHKLGLLRWSGCHGDDFAGAAFGFNLGTSRGTKRVSSHGEFLLQVTLAEDLDSSSATVGQTESFNSIRVHLCAIFELIQRIEVDREVTNRMPRVIEAALGNTANEGHLAAFKSNADGTARAGGLAFATAAARFAMSAGLALAQTFAAMLGAWTRFEIV